MGRFTLGLVFMVLSSSLQAKDPDILISGNYRNVPFTQFVEELESRTNTRFFFRVDWMKGISINASGEEISLSVILEEAFSGSPLEYLITENRQVFITMNVKLIRDLPEYIPEVREERAEEGEENLRYLPAEERYLEGRSTGKAETIVIGSEEANTGGDRVVITGRILDQSSGEPLIGASILIEELKTGVVTDIHGQYNLILSPGRYSAVVNCMGMQERRYFLQVWSDDRFDIDMEPRIIPINEVTVTADQYHNVRGIQMGFERLNIKTIKEIPIAMGEKDLLKIVQMLPGIQSVGEGSAGINVRGSAADQNLFYINKLPVYNPSHLFGFFSSFSPDIIKDFSFYKSNMPASFGGRLASVFDIATTQGNKKQFTARGGISPITGHVAVEGPIVKESVSYVLSGRSTYSDWILSRLEDPDFRNSKAFFYDLSANLSIEPNERNLLHAFAYHSNDRLQLAGTNEYRYKNQGLALGWRHQISPAVSADIHAVMSTYSFSTIEGSFPMKAYSHEYQLDHYEIRSDFTWYGGQKHKITFGGNAIWYDLARGDVIPYGPESLRNPVALGNEKGLEGAFYAGDEVRILPGLTLYGGLRYSYFLMPGPGTVNLYYPDVPKTEESIREQVPYESGRIIRRYSGPEPRLALNLMTGRNHSLKFSYNRIRQYLFMLSNTIAISPVDQWKLVDYHIKPPYADQVSAGYYRDFPRAGLNTSLEIYYKKTRNLVEFRDAAEFISSPYIETEVLQGDQTAYGLELMLKKNTGKLNGWLSYAFSRSVVLVDGPLRWERINNGKVYPSNYDKPHAFNLVGNCRITRRLSFSGNLVYSTGRPFTAPKDIYYLNGQPIVNYSERNEYRIPDYFRVDFSMNIEGNLKARKLAHSYWMINVYNLTGRKNAYSVYFQSEEGLINGYKMSVFGTPIVTVSWNFKLGNYASE